MLLLETVLNYTKLGIECIGVFVILLEVLRSVYQLFISIAQSQPSYNLKRLQFGEFLSWGPEFIVGAGIIGSLLKSIYDGLDYNHSFSDHQNDLKLFFDFRALFFESALDYL